MEYIRKTVYPNFHSTFLVSMAGFEIDLSLFSVYISTLNTIRPSCADDILIIEKDRAIKKLESGHSYVLIRAYIRKTPFGFA